MSDSTPETNASDDEYRVAPADPNVVTPDPMMLMPNIDPPADEEPEGPRRFQFSLRELILLVTGASVFLSIVRSLPGGSFAKAFAGWAGLLVLVAMILMACLQPKRLIFRVGWWVLLGLYLAACAAAILQG